MLKLNLNELKSGIDRNNSKEAKRKRKIMRLETNTDNNP